MPKKHCIHCSKQTLFPTGAFWACIQCGWAITSQALGEMTKQVYYPKRRA